MADSRQEERVANPMVRWYFTKEELENSPSRRHNVDPNKELSYRQQTASMIHEMGHRLKLNQICTATAIVYMHRFFMVHSFRTFNRWNIASAALFLAAKVEEQPQKLEYVARVYHSCINRDHPIIDSSSEEFTKLIEEITNHELMILETLGFDLRVEHAHPHVVKCTQLVRASKDLSQTAYFMAHNSLLLTTFCLEHRPTIVACCCINLACVWKGIEIPPSQDLKKWWEYVDPTITQGLLDALTKEFLDIYGKSPSKLQKKMNEQIRLAQKQNKLKQEESVTSGSSSQSDAHFAHDNSHAPSSKHSRTLSSSNQPSPLPKTINSLHHNHKPHPHGHLPSTDKTHPLLSQDRAVKPHPSQDRAVKPHQPKPHQPLPHDRAVKPHPPLPQDRTVKPHPSKPHPPLPNDRSVKPHPPQPQDRVVKPHPPQDRVVKPHPPQPQDRLGKLHSANRPQPSSKPHPPQDRAVKPHPPLAQDRSRQIPPAAKLVDKHRMVSGDQHNRVNHPGQESSRSMSSTLQQPSKLGKRSYSSGVELSDKRRVKPDSYSLSLPPLPPSSAQGSYSHNNNISSFPPPLPPFPPPMSLLVQDDSPPPPPPHM